MALGEVGGDELLAAIRLRAYFMWERAGRPDGGDMAFWDEARREIDREKAGAAAGASD